MEAQNNKPNLCTSLIEYIVENGMDKVVTALFFNKQLSNKFKKWIRKSPSKTFLIDTLHEQLVNYYAPGKFCQQIKDYSEINKFYMTHNVHANYYRCDLIRPKLPDTTDSMCQRGIGQYFLQYGIPAYKEFIKYLAQFPNHKKEEEASKNVKMSFNALQKWLEMVSKYPVIGKGLILVGEQKINLYYLMNCEKTVSDYNAFYDFYKEKLKSISQPTKNSVGQAKCDCFQRLNGDFKKPIDYYWNNK